MGVIGVVLVSAILSLMRGFTREVLAIGSWVAAAAAAYYFHPYVMPYLDHYIKKPVVLEAVSAAVVFFATLIVVSLFTVRLSDAILDSKIGALDRSLGFVFGAVRGFLLAVVAFAIFSWLVGDKQQPDWVANAKTRPVLTDSADRIVAMLPDDAAQTLESWIKAKAAPAAPMRRLTSPNPPPTTRRPRPNRRPRRRRRPFAAPPPTARSSTR
jgi:membrane protein required for colicin V production